MHPSNNALPRHGQPLQEIPPAVLKDMRTANARADDGATPIPTLWFWQCDEQGNALAVGRCPLCHRLHGHGISRDPLRVPHCSSGTPRFPNEGDKPPLVRLRYAEGEMPDDVAFELGVDRPDLLTLAAVAKGTSAWSRERTRIAIQSIRRIGVLDERIALMADGEGLTVKEATRTALAHFIRRQPGRRMRVRLGHALLRAYIAAGRGAMLP